MLLHQCQRSALARAQRRKHAAERRRIAHSLGQRRARLRHAFGQCPQARQRGALRAAARIEPALQRYRRVFVFQRLGIQRETPNYTWAY